MVSTIKFSEFTTGALNDSSRKVAGIASGANVINNAQNTWTTLTRPTSPFDGLQGYNSDLEQWEYWQQSTLTWLQFETSTSGENWEVITVSSFNAMQNAGYIANRSATPVNLILPATFNAGDFVLLMGMGTGGWNLVCNTGQKIIFGSVQTSVDGSISSDIQYSNIEVKGMVDNSIWTVWVTNSNPTYL